MIKKFVIGITIIPFLIFQAALAEEISASGLSPSEIQSAVNSANPGDVIILPSGTYSGFNSTVNVPNGISIRGQGKDSTVLRITSKIAALFSWNDSGRASTSRVTISNMKLIGLGDGHSLDGGLRLLNGMADFRIYNCQFEGFGNYGVMVDGDSRGVIHDCRFINCYTDTVGYGVVVHGDGVWDNPKPGLGTQNAVFVEDCYFNGCKHAISSNIGSHYVFRYNTVEGLKHNKYGVDAHGKQPAWPCGSNTYEIYGNIVYGSGSEAQTDWGICVRGGDGVIFDNLVYNCDPGTYGGPSKAIAVNIDDHGGYPDTFQVKELYLWGNDHDDQQISSIYVTSEAEPYVQQNREYFFSTKGGYSPYSYPHPLRQQSEPESPHISLTPSSLEFSAVSEGNNPSDKIFQISNSGDGSLDWSVTDDGTWLSCSPASGTGSSNITASVDISGLSAGTYESTITVTSNNADNSPQQISVTLTVTNPPLATSASGSPTSGEAPLTVNFEASVSGGASPYSYNWNFDDNTSSSDKNPSHTFSDAGEYSITLTVTDSNNSQASDSLTVNVSASTSPLSVSASGSPTSGEAPLTVNFEASVSGGTSPYSYNWNFGDNTSSSKKNPSHTFSDAGEYSVTLTVTDSNNSQASDSLTLNVSVSTSSLSVSASASPTSGEAPLTVNFTVSVSGGTSPYSYNWNFGDNTSSSDKNPSHTFSNAGEYSVTLTVTDSGNNQTPDSLTISAKEATTSETSLTISSATGSPAQGEGGTTDPSPGKHTYALGTTLQIKTTSNDGYRFAKWTGDVSDSQAFNQEITITMDRNKSITAYFYAKCGDVNGDLTISPSDSQAAFDIFLGKISDPTESEMENADVNCDGTKTAPKITPADAHSIFKKYVGKKELPCDCSCNSRTASLSSQQDQTEDINLIIDDITPTPGGEITVPVLVDKPFLITSFGFDLIYPPDALEFVGVERIEPSKETYRADANKIAEGVVRAGGYKNIEFLNDSNRVLIKIIFRVAGEAEGPISFTVLNPEDDIKNASYRQERLSERRSDSRHVK